ncbi:hypothetical protein K505DRAFT_261360 [Melanomma pulvis-pyrius CBS 109.77]|uniref:Uncharacterized protein n=1 Tax=Melanomma pulvis-pyrius CBS 109.77 TaxID=1314802 RepID=A0A6A6WNX2_9PLEO|nr:hypothetical protein K505DRAFT_261360 [Melanomma pulvis-pyrius CBS 109.77]
MSKRHNRKRTRSRPRHRDGGKAHSNKFRTLSTYKTSFHSTTSSISQYTFVYQQWADHFHQKFSAWQTPQNIQQNQQKQIAKAQRLHFGGEAGEEDILFEPMLKVVMDLFDGGIDYEDP